MSNYYLCDYCGRNLRDCSVCSCVCRIAGEEVVKAVVSDGDHVLDCCLWFRPLSTAQGAQNGLQRMPSEKARHHA